MGCVPQMGSGVRAIQVRPWGGPIGAGEEQMKCFHVLRTDGSAEDFSVRKCLLKLFPQWASEVLGCPVPSIPVYPQPFDVMCDTAWKCFPHCKWQENVAAGRRTQSDPRFSGTVSFSLAVVAVLSASVHYPHRLVVLQNEPASLFLDVVLDTAPGHGYHKQKKPHASRSLYSYELVTKQLRAEGG